jgi:hypothetical protein
MEKFQNGQIAGINATFRPIRGLIDEAEPKESPGSTGRGEYFGFGLIVF